MGKVSATRDRLRLGLGLARLSPVTRERAGDLPDTVPRLLTGIAIALEEGVPSLGNGP